MTSSMEALDAALDAAITVVRSHSRFLLTTHVNADGDGLGSELALASWLQNIDKEVRIVNCSPTPDVYRFLDPQNTIYFYDAERDSPRIFSADVIMMVDTNDPARLQSMQQSYLQSPAYKICIDHHLDATPFADLFVIDTDATSTGEIVYRMLRRSSLTSLNQDAASALYCAIMTDTGSFRYPRADAEILRIAADLVEEGADPVRIYSEVFEQWTKGRIHLLGEALSTMGIAHEGRVAYLSITKDMLQRTNTKEEDTDNFTVYPMSLNGVQIGILFLELNDGMKVSFRSKGKIPVNELAREFGGNGHLNAAGARIDHGSLEHYRQKIVEAAKAYLSNEMNS
jgi:phosphoesterase RecJ-like protein